MTNHRRELHQAGLDFYQSLTPLEQSRDEYIGVEETVASLIQEEEMKWGTLTDKDAPTLALFLQYLEKAQAATTEATPE